jgi:DNA topoisomerase-1
MEKGGIGTKATRAGILQTLYDRKYIRGEKITVTDLGLEVIGVLREYCPSVVSTDFTRQLEEKMDRVQQGQANKSGIISDAIENLKNVTCALFENEKEIGKKLSYASQEARMEERIIGACPTCQTGKLIIQYSKKTGKRFIGCTNYFTGICRTAFPLPQKGIIKPSGKTCKDCGLTTVLVWLGARRPWNLCFNPYCPSKRSQDKF